MCRLYKFLYGLKQAPRARYTHLSDFILFIGFRASKVDTSLFILFVGDDIFYLLVYVNDILLIGSNFTMLHRLIQLLRSEFKFRDLGTAHYFLGIEVQSTSMDLMLRQYKYTLVDTPISTSKAIILRILCYFHGTTTYGLHITRSFSFALYGFTNTDWASSIDYHKSTGSYLVRFYYT